MPKVDYNLFIQLWNKIENRYCSENDVEFSLAGLKIHSEKFGITLSAIDINNIRVRFFDSYRAGETKSEVNLSLDLYEKLFRYGRVKGFGDFTGVIDTEELVKRVEAEVNYGVAGEPAVISFIGREKELEILATFINNPVKRIFGLYGVPMIGKTWLMQQFLEKNPDIKNFDLKAIILKPLPDNPEENIRQVLFSGTKMNDFAVFTTKTLIVIQNFEEVLKWKGSENHLHEIQENYGEIKRFLELVTTNSNIKLVLESRFLLNKSFIPYQNQNSIQLLPELQLSGVDTELFWNYYKKRNVTRREFEKLCGNFDNHTGLLALAYNDVEWLYENDLTQAVYQPKLVTKRLWEYIGQIISKLEKQEIWILCTLTYLQKPVTEKEITKILSDISNASISQNIDAHFFSLKKKLLIQSQKGDYELNPYLREVCYTFLKDKRKSQMDELSQISFIKAHGNAPQYNILQQAIERYDYMFLFNMGKRFRQERNFDRALEYLEAGLLIDPKPENVLNEIGIVYKQRNQIQKAIEVFQKAVELGNSQSKNELAICYKIIGDDENALKLWLELTNTNRRKHIPAFNELAVYYREKKLYKEAITVLLSAIELDDKDVKTLNSLAICYRDTSELFLAKTYAQKAILLSSYQTYTVLTTIYQKMGNIELAYETAKKGMTTVGWDNSRLKAKLNELEKIIKMKNRKMKIFISYSHKDEDIKEKLDTHLAALKKSNKIATWNDRKIGPGEEWDNVIKKQMEEADIILLLVSANFIESEYIWNVEIKQAVKRHNNKEAILIPIFCKPCDFKDMPFQHIQGLPKDAKPVTTYPDTDIPLSEIAKAIRKIVETKDNR